MKVISQNKIMVEYFDVYLMKKEKTNGNGVYERDQFQWKILKIGNINPLAPWDAFSSPETAKIPSQVPAP